MSFRGAYATRNLYAFGYFKISPFGRNDNRMSLKGLKIAISLWKCGMSVKFKIRRRGDLS